MLVAGALGLLTGCGPPGESKASPGPAPDARMDAAAERAGVRGSTDYAAARAAAADLAAAWAGPARPARMEEEVRGAMEELRALAPDPARPLTRGEFEALVRRARELGAKERP